MADILILIQPFSLVNSYFLFFCFVSNEDQENGTVDVSDETCLPPTTIIIILIFRVTFSSRLLQYPLN